MSSQLALRPQGSAAAAGELMEASPIIEDLGTTRTELAGSIDMMTTPSPALHEYLRAFNLDLETVNAAQAEAPILVQSASPNRADYLAKMRDYENSHRRDLYLDREHFPVLISAFKRIDRVQNLVGHGNFNVISFDEMLAYGRQYASVGAFSRAEQDFLEDLFSANATRYGFLGEKVITRLTEKVPTKERQKIGRTGHYLYKGESVGLYEKLKKDVGGTIVLTSGIRSVVKQTHLFLAKTIQSKGNMSRASRSLAPPGHSYHGIGDFDVGKVGFGRKNFSEEFARTDEFMKLVELGYVDIRYPKDNLYGVRYEPWHIKVV